MGRSSSYHARPFLGKPGHERGQRIGEKTQTATDDAAVRGNESLDTNHSNSGNMLYLVPPVLVTGIYFALGEIRDAGNDRYLVPPFHPIAGAFIHPGCLSIFLGREVVGEKQY